MAFIARHHRPRHAAVEILCCHGGDRRDGLPRTSPNERFWPSAFLILSR